MDAEGLVLWNSVKARAGEHDKAVFAAHNASQDALWDAYWVDWNGFKSRLKAQQDDIDSTFSIVLNSEIEARNQELEAMIARFNLVAVEVASANKAGEISLLEAAIAKQKAGIALSDADIALLAKYHVASEVHKSPVKPNVTPADITAKMAATPSSGVSVAWYLVGGAVGIVIIGKLAENYIGSGNRRR